MKIRIVRGAIVIHTAAGEAAAVGRSWSAGGGELPGRSGVCHPPCAAPWQCFDLRPLPHVQGSLRPRWASSVAYTAISSAGARPAARQYGGRFRPA